MGDKAAVEDAGAVEKKAVRTEALGRGTDLLRIAHSATSETKKLTS